MIYAMPIERWRSNAASLHDAYTASLGHIRELLGEGVDGVQVSLFEKFGYIGDSPEEIATQAYNNELIQTIRDAGVEPLTSGPSLLKHHGLARRDYIPIVIGKTIHRVINRELILGEGQTMGNINAVAHVQSLPKNMVCKLYFILDGGERGTVYINHADGTHITKGEVANGKETCIVYIPLIGITPHSFLYKGASGDRVTLTRLTLSEVYEEELSGYEQWTGTSRSGFYHVRTPNPLDTQGLFDTYFGVRKFPNTRLVSCCDELNGPFGHSQEFKNRYHGGWPQWLGEMVVNYANIAYRLTGHKPILFLTDPRKSVEELRNNRACAPVPHGYTCDYLKYVPKETPVTFFVWTERASEEVWRNLRKQTEGYDTIGGIYAGKQDIGNAINGFGGDKWGVFYWGAEKPNALPTIRLLKSYLT